MVLTYHQIKSSIKDKKYNPVYFLHGVEPYFIDSISDYIDENALNETEKVFNQIIFYGKDVTAQTVVDQAQRYPIMAPFQVIIVREAQEMRDFKDLETYIQKPVPSTLLVLCYKHKTFDMRTAFGKAIAQSAVVFKSEKIKDYQLADWITDFAKAEKYKIAPAAVQLLAEYLGSDISVVVHELNKLSLHLKDGQEITPHHIEQYIGISREYNVFELHKALAYQDKKKISRIMHYLMYSSKKSSVQMVIGSLAGFFTKVYALHSISKVSDREIMDALALRNNFALQEYKQAIRSFSREKTEEIIGILHEYDLKSKGVGYNSVGKEDKEILSEMIWRIMN